MLASARLARHITPSARSSTVSPASRTETCARYPNTPRRSGGAARSCSRFPAQSPPPEASSPNPILNVPSLLRWRRSSGCRRTMRVGAATPVSAAFRLRPSDSSGKISCASPSRRLRRQPAGDDVEGPALLQTDQRVIDARDKPRLRAGDGVGDIGSEEVERQRSPRQAPGETRDEQRERNGQRRRASAADDDAGAACGVAPLRAALDRREMAAQSSCAAAATTKMLLSPPSAYDHLPAPADDASQRLGLMHWREAAEAADPALAAEMRALADEVGRATASCHPLRQQSLS